MNKKQHNIMYIPKDVCRVAVIHPTHQAFGSEIVKMLHRLTLPGTAYSQFQCSFFPTELNRSLVQKQVHSVLDKHFNVFVTVGRLASMHAKEIFDAYGGYAQLCVGVSEPVKSGLAASLEEPNDSATAITRTPPDLGSIARHLTYLSPHRNKVLIPYEPNGEAGRIDEQVRISESILLEAGMTVQLLPITEYHDLLSVLEMQTIDFDTVLFLEGCVSGDIAREAAHLCWERDILLCGNGLDAIRFGAPCTFGGDLYPYIEATFAILKRFWYEKTPMGAIPVTILPDDQKFVVNTHMLRAIGMSAEAIKQFINQPNIEVIKERI